VSTIAAPQTTVEARGRLGRTVAPLLAARPAERAAFYRTCLRWLGPQGVPPVRERTTLIVTAGAKLPKRAE
jgi:hypothetical protein